MLDPEKAIRDWRKSLQKNAALSDSDIAELESHLRDEIDRRSAAGADPESAFRAALDLSAGLDDLGAEFGKSRRRRGPRNALLGLFPAYLRLALRRTVKHKGHSFLNVLALTVGLAACGLVLLYVRFETSVDAFREDADRIYRVNLYRKTAQGEDVIAGNYTPLAPVLKERYPQVEAAAHGLLRRLRAPARRLSRQGLQGSEHLLRRSGPAPCPRHRAPAGRPRRRSRAQRHSASLGEDGRKVLRPRRPLGKTIRVNDRDCEVTGIIADPPANTQFQHDVVMSARSEIEREEFLQGWRPGIHGTMTLVKLKSGVDAAAFETLIRDLPHEYAAEDLRKLGAVNRMVLQPLKKLHLYEATVGGLVPSPRLVYLYIFPLSPS
ncbi:MAG: ABC transporter permease [Candidatus Moduliflexus flocculans]|nr:ABC transporter permease [Candidatus Moduliflexus flocculans]